MKLICENIVEKFIKFFFGETKEDVVIKKNDQYTLSSVFPTKKIMTEVKEYLNKC